MKELEQILRDSGFAVLDGAMSTALESKGLDLNDPLWTAKALADHPEKIAQVHRDYFAAGADVGISASYQASVPGFAARGYTRAEALAFIAQSVRLLNEAREEWWRGGGALSGRAWPLSAGSCGPYGAYLADGNEYRGAYDLSEAEYRAFHEPRIKALADAGADLIAIETQPRLDEALVCARLCEEAGVPYWITFTCMSEQRISSGTEIRTVCRALADAGLTGLAAVGANCIQPKLAEGVVRSFRAHTQLPVAVYPNSGKRYDPVTKTWSGGPGQPSFGAMAAAWYDAGARLIGGCCTTLFEDVAEIYKLREQRKEQA